jgi:hypothetical protein
MWRTALAVVAGLVAWAAIVTLINFGLEAAIPGYREAMPTMVFTLTMKISRLVMAAVTSVLAGVVVRLVAPASRFAPWITGGIILALFLPEHIQIWPRFPVWYHLSFLVPLVPLVVLGSVLAAKLRRKPSVAPA